MKRKRKWDEVHLWGSGKKQNNQEEETDRK